MDLRGFIPASQLRTGSPFDGLVGQTIEAKILEADAKRNKLILSQRQAIAEQRDQVVDNVLAELSEDQVVTGEIVRIADFGAFIDIGVHQDGLVHISQICDKYIKHPSEVLKVGDVVDVKIISVDPEKNRISLTMRF